MRLRDWLDLGCERRTEPEIGEGRERAKHEIFSELVMVNLRCLRDNWMYQFVVQKGIVVGDIVRDLPE